MKMPITLIIAITILSFSFSLHGQSGQTNTNTIYFLLTEIEPKDGSSFVVPLSKPEHIEQARNLITSNITSQMVIVTNSGRPTTAYPAMYIGTRASLEGNGINRNYNKPGFPAYDWHIYEVTVIDYCKSHYYLEWELFNAEMLKTYKKPSQKTLAGNYTVWEDYKFAKELGPNPLFVGLSQKDGDINLSWTGVGINTLYKVESTDSLTDGKWTTEASNLTESQTNQWKIPISSEKKRFYRVVVE